MNPTIAGLAVLLLLVSQVLGLRAAEAQYTVEPQSTVARGHLWVGDGPAAVLSANRSAANRFRLGAEIHIGEEHRYILGWTVFDRLSSGERSTSVGEISRPASDFNFGYFLIRDRLWAMYSLQLADVGGSTVIGKVTVVGHQASVGWRFFSDGSFSLSAEAAYLFAPSYAAATYNFATNVPGTANFPPASVWSLNLRAGFDFGGR